MSVVTSAAVSMTNEDYHRDYSRDSNSSKELYRESRETYEAIRVLGTMEPPPPTDDMILGTHCHTALLEPDVFANRATQMPNIEVPELAPDGKKWLRRKGSDHEKWWAEFEEKRERQLADWRAENVGKYEISDKHLATATAVREAALANEVIRSLIEETPPHRREHTVVWDCCETGLPLKSRRDIYHDRLICDIKTIGVTLSAASVARRIASLGYHRQADFYTMGEQAFSGENRAFVFLFLSTKPPYSVGLFDIDGDDLAFARKQNLETLAAMERCRRDPSQYKPDYAKGIFTVTLPGWAKHEDDWGF